MIKKEIKTKPSQKPNLKLLWMACIYTLLSSYMSHHFVGIREESYYFATHA